MTTILSLSLLAGFAATISAITGVAGGVLLLSGLVLCIPAGAVVPIHGLVQFAAGTSRMIAFRRDVEWSLVVPFVLTMIPGACLGAYGLSFLYALNPSWLLIIIAMVIIFTIRPRKHLEKPVASSQHSKLNLAILGFSCGILGMFVGSTGPIVSGWLLGHGIVKEAHIGSKSVMQGSAHLVKVPLFAWGLSFDFTPYTQALVGMVLMVLLGTWFGKWCLQRVSKHAFALITRVILSIIVLKIFITELPQLF
jgi:uncharacterized protein